MSDDEEEMDLEYLEVARAKDMDDMFHIRLLSFGLGVVFYAAAEEISAELVAAEDREERMLRYHEPRKYASRESIQRPENSDWHHVFNCNDNSDETWFTWVGLPKPSFLELVELATPYFENNAIVAFRRDRPTGETGKPRPQDIARRSLDREATLGIALKFLICSSEIQDIGKMFGLVDTVARKYINFGIKIIVHILIDHHRSKIEWKADNASYLEAMSDLTRLYVPELHDWGLKPVAFIDGVRFQIGNKWKSPAARKEDQSGEKKLSLRKIILLSDPTGYIVAVVLNIPGSWGDSKATRLMGVYALIEELLDGYNVVADTAFKGDLLLEKVVKVLKEGEYIPAGLSDEDLIEVESYIRKARMPGEWINRDFVACFKRLRQILGIYDDVNSKMMLASILVHNWRVRTCNRNQVKKFFEICKLEADRLVARQQQQQLHQHQD